MNNDLEQFSEERLKEIIEAKFDTAELSEQKALARIALAAKQAKPVTMDSLRDAIAEMSGGLPMEWKEGNDKGHHAVPFINFNSLHRIVTKFTIPQPAHTEQDGWKLVPIEPNAKMIGAASGQSMTPIKCWEVMLAAAPKPESE